MLLKLDNTSGRKNTANLSQFHAVACREHTLPREEEEASQPKGWIQGNSKIEPVLEVATSYLHGKYGVEIRIWSLNRDNTHSWVRISHGSNRFVMNLNNNETEIPEVQLEEYALKLDAKDFACRSNAKAKPQRREPAGSSPRIVPMERRNWIDIEPGKYSFSDYEVSKKVTYLLRRSQHVHREEDGAVHIWRIKEKSSESVPTLPSLVGQQVESILGRRRRSKKEISVLYWCFRNNCLFSEFFKDIQDANLIDPSLPDNVIVRSNFFQYIYHVGCASNSHSIISSALIHGGQSSSKRQTVFILLLVDPVDNNHKDPDVIDLSVPRHAQYLHKAWKRHQDAVYWVDINLAITKGLKILSDSIECNHSSRNTSSLLYSESC